MAQARHVLHSLTPSPPVHHLHLLTRQIHEGLGHKRGEVHNKYTLQIIPILIALFWYFRPIIPRSVYFQAYLVLREREAAGLEPLSKDFINPEKLLAHLPSDDELKEAGVVINI